MQALSFIFEKIFVPWPATRGERPSSQQFAGFPQTATLQRMAEGFDT